MSRISQPFSYSRIGTFVNKKSQNIKPLFVKKEDGTAATPVFLASNLGNGVRTQASPKYHIYTDFEETIPN